MCHSEGELRDSVFGLMVFSCEAEESAPLKHQIENETGKP